jgi:hypothetical protein
VRFDGERRDGANALKSGGSRRAPQTKSARRFRGRSTANLSIYLPEFGAKRKKLFSLAPESFRVRIVATARHAPRGPRKRMVLKS